MTIDASDADSRDTSTISAQIPKTLLDFVDAEIQAKKIKNKSEAVRKGLELLQNQGAEANACPSPFREQLNHIAAATGYSPPEVRRLLEETRADLEKDLGRKVSFQEALGALADSLNVRLEVLEEQTKEPKNAFVTLFEFVSSWSNIRSNCAAANACPDCPVREGCLKTSEHMLNLEQFFQKVKQLETDEELQKMLKALEMLKEG